MDYQRGGRRCGDLRAVEEHPRSTYRQVMDRAWPALSAEADGGRGSVATSATATAAELRCISASRSVAARRTTAGSTGGRNLRHYRRVKTVLLDSFAECGATLVASSCRRTRAFALAARGNSDRSCHAGRRIEGGHRPGCDHESGQAGAGRRCMSHAREQHHSASTYASIATDERIRRATVLPDHLEPAAVPAPQGAALLVTGASGFLGSYRCVHCLRERLLR